MAVKQVIQQMLQAGSVELPGKPQQSNVSGCFDRKVYSS